jgi:hypothetical protein
MASPAAESSGPKRKRSPIDDTITRPPPVMHAGAVTQINYLVKAKYEKLRLIEGDSETFGDILGMIDDYEGVLEIYFHVTFISYSSTSTTASVICFDTFIFLELD